MTRPRSRCLKVAQHEAAHVVVGCALGLRLIWARINTDGQWALGETNFASTPRSLAQGIMYAAGIAWERVSGGDIYHARIDRKLAAANLRRDDERADIRAAVVCAESILHARHELHEAVTALLCERDITGADVARIVEAHAAPRD